MSEDKKPGYIFNYIADVGAGQQFQITGNFPLDVTKTQVKAEFQLFRDVIESHRTQSAIPGLEKDIQGLELGIKQSEDAVAEIVERNQGKPMKSADVPAHDGALSNIRKLKLDLEERKKLLAKWKSEIAE